MTEYDVVQGITDFSVPEDVEFTALQIDGDLGNIAFPDGVLPKVGDRIGWEVYEVTPAGAIKCKFVIIKPNE